MKKIFSAAVAVLMVAVGAQAQGWNKGDWFTGVQLDDVDLCHSTYDLGWDTEFSVGVNAGYFLTNKLAVDAMAGLDTYKYKFDDEKFSGTSGTLGLGVRYYPVSNLFARVGMQSEFQKDYEPFTQARVGVGYDFFISEKVFVTPTAYYNVGLNKDVNGDKTYGLAVGFGVRF